MKTQHWLVKTEPDSYSWDQFVKDGRTDWTGVRNYTARIHLNAMSVRDRVLVYESMTTKAVVGIAEVVQTAFPDKTAEEPGWVAVGLKAVSPLAKPITLAQIKADPLLAKMEMLRLNRLSVVPVRPEEFERILALAK